MSVPSPLRTRSLNAETIAIRPRRRRCRRCSHRYGCIGEIWKLKSRPPLRRHERAKPFLHTLLSEVLRALVRRRRR
jgi:hypothetical protein